MRYDWMATDKFSWGAIKPELLFSVMLCKIIWCNPEWFYLLSCIWLTAQDTEEAEITNRALLK
jgi:hypothetical protein